MADEPPSPSSEEEYFDAVDDTAPRADDAPVVTAELVDGEDALAAQMRRLEAHSNASLCATASTASTAELPVETHGMPCGPNGCTRAEGEEEGHRVPCLSRYRVSAGSVHPLADLAPSLSALFIGGAEQEDSLSEMHTESLSCGSRSSLGAHSVALSLRPAEDGAAEQPKKVRVRAKRKSRAEFSRLLLVQELDPAPAPDDADASASSAGAAPQKPLFTVKFNHDGNFLAAAGEDGVVRVWKLLVDDVAAAGGEHEGYAPPRMGSIFQQHPLQHFCGHQGAVLDLSWSRNNFLLSASMDQTVRLWHCSRPDCLGVFRHPDFVTSVAFHPRDDRIFITGSLDCRLRLWSIAERSVKAWNELPPNNFVTAVAFTTSGRYALAGTTTGVCLLFETEVLPCASRRHSPAGLQLLHADPRALAAGKEQDRQEDLRDRADARQVERRAGTCATHAPLIAAADPHQHQRQPHPALHPPRQVGHLKVHRTQEHLLTDQGVLQVRGLRRR